MTRYCFTRPLATTAGGLLAVILSPMPIAFADQYQIVPDPGSTETVVSVYGLHATPPAVPETVQGYQLFDYVDKTTGQTVGTFEADESYSDNLYGRPTLELLVTDDVSGTSGTAAGDTPPADSVFDIRYNPNGTEQIYSDLASPSGNDVVSEVRQTAQGDYAIRTFFDASKGLADGSVDDHEIDFPNGDSILPLVGTTETFTAISGDPPSDDAIQGEQEFAVLGPDGSQVGTVDADVTNTQDIAGNYTEALVVTQDLSGTSGTAAGDVLPVGTMLNIFYYPTGATSLYTVVPSADGDEIVHTTVHPFGRETTKELSFDATNALTTHDIDLPADDEQISPISSLDVTGINGLPPSHVSIQGYQEFEINDSATQTQLGTFDADVTNYSYESGKYGEILVVTDDLSGTSGTGPGDVPPVGSVFDISVSSNSETIYSDLASPSGDTITQYVVNSSGEQLKETTLDLAALFAHDNFFVPSDLAAADPAALPAMDASAGLGTLLDAFPHMEAVLNVVAGLL